MGASWSAQPAKMPHSIFSEKGPVCKANQHVKLPSTEVWVPKYSALDHNARGSPKGLPGRQVLWRRRKGCRAALHTNDTSLRNPAGVIRWRWLRHCTRTEVPATQTQRQPSHVRSPGDRGGEPVCRKARLSLRCLGRSKPFPEYVSCTQTTVNLYKSRTSCELRSDDAIRALLLRVCARTAMPSGPARSVQDLNVRRARRWPVLVRQRCIEETETGNINGRLAIKKRRARSTNGNMSAHRGEKHTER